MYTLTLGKDSCIASVLQTRIVPDCAAAKLVFPNAFTPGGMNPVFRVIQNADLWQIQDYELQVYSRWGNQVYRGLDYNRGWDGSGANSGVYFWLCRYTLLNGTRWTQKGELTLIR
jgi:hypothetical protein